MNHNGYDIISLVSVSHLNNQVRKGWNTERSSIRFQEEGLDMQGVCDPWSLIPGEHSGIYVRIRLPINRGKLEIQDQRDTRTYDLAGVTLTLELTLDFVVTNASGGGRQLQFAVRRVLKDATQRRFGDVKQIGYICPISVDTPQGQTWKNVDRYALMLAVCEAMIERYDIVRFAFASLQTNSQQQLPPIRSSRYCYMQNGYIAVMSLCDTRDAATMPAEVIGMCQYGNAMLSISGELLFRHLSHSLQNIFADAISPSECSVSHYNLCVSARKRIMGIRVLALDYCVYCSHLELYINGSDRLSVVICGDSDLYVGITMTFKYTLDCTLRHQQDRIYFDVQPTTTGDKWYHADVPWYLSILLGLPNLFAKVISSDISTKLSPTLASQMHLRGMSGISWIGDHQGIVASYFDTNLTLEYKLT